MAYWRANQTMAPAEPTKTAKKRVQEIKAVQGIDWKIGDFPRKPACSRCQAAGESNNSIEQRVPPAKIERKRGAKRRVDTSKQFCSEERCEYCGWLDRGNIVSNGHPNGGAWRQLQCTVCGKYFQETTGTVFYGFTSVYPPDLTKTRK